jgi:hypothetical protein
MLNLDLSGLFGRKEALPAGFRTPADRKEQAEKLCQMIEAGTGQKGTLPLRWERNERMYRNDPPKRTGSPYDGASDVHDPLVQPKLDALTSNVVGTITAQDPYIVTRVRGSQDRAYILEQDLQFAFEEGRLSERLRTLSPIVGYCGKGVLRAHFEEREDGFAGMTFEVVHPREFIAYPAAVREIPKMRMVGHRMPPLRVREIKEKQKAGVYLDDGQSVTGGYDPEGQQTRFLTTSAAGIVDNEDMLVECYEVVFRHPGQDGKERWLLATVSLSDRALLKVAEYPYSRPWYFDFAFKREHGGFWFQDSVAQDLQGLQLEINGLHNTLHDGQQMASFGATFIDASAMPEGVEKTAPGQIIPVDDLKGVQAYFPPFRSQEIPFLMQYIRQRADEVARIPATASGGQFRGSITATEASQIAAGGQTGINEFIANFGLGMEDLARFCIECLKTNFAFWKQAHGEVVKAESPDDYTKIVRIDLNGKSPSNTPQAQFGMASTLLQVAGTLPPEVTGLDAYQLIKALVQNSGLQNVEKIQMPEEQFAQTQQRAAMPQQPAMAGAAMAAGDPYGATEPALGGPGGADPAMESLLQQLAMAAAHGGLGGPTGEPALGLGEAPPGGGYEPNPGQG